MEQKEWNFNVYPWENHGDCTYCGKQDVTLYKSTCASGDGCCKSCYDAYWEQATRDIQEHRLKYGEFQE